MREKSNIHFCSIGLRLPQITLETLNVLKKTKKIFLFIEDNNIERFLEINKLKDKAETMSHSYDNDFSKISDEIIKKALKEKDIAILSYGYPSFINGLWNYVLQKANLKNINVNLINAIGSLNPLLHLAKFYEIPKTGLHFFNAIDIKSSKDIDLNMHIPCFILNPHNLKQNKKSELINVLNKALENKLFIYLIEAASAGGFMDNVVEVKNIKQLNRHINVRNTLLITDKKIN